MKSRPPDYPNDHGQCLHCGLDLNGEWIYGYFLKESGDHTEALAKASMYGAKEGYGRFGRAIYVKDYDEDYNKLPPYFKCPDCGEKCYDSGS